MSKCLSGINKSLSQEQLIFLYLRLRPCAPPFPGTCTEIQPCDAQCRPACCRAPLWLMFCGSFSMFFFFF